MEATKNAGALDVQGAEARDAKKRSALHWASANGLGSTVAKLLSLGANAALEDGDRNTSLILACMNNHEAVAAQLMEATQNAGALDVQDSMCIWEVCVRNCGACATCKKFTYYSRSALHWASANGLESTVAKLLSLGANAALKEWKSQGSRK
jgi:ankyrin repeat protein